MYVRTKDGVYKVIQANDIYTEVKGNTNGVPLNNGNTAIHFKEILNQSENLDELCDLFIDEETKTIFHKHNGYVINWKTNMVYSLKALSESYHSVKGAIYTDDGLIYVAKIDNEGKLELI